VFKTSTPVFIDGALSEAAWEQATSVELTDPVTGRTPSARTRAKLLWTDSALVVGFQCDDTNILTQFSQRDELLWKDDVVEIFIAAGSLTETFGGYTEIEVNARGAVLDLFVLRAVDGVPYPLPYKSYNLNIRAATRAQGSINDTTQTDTGWTAEIAIPLAELRHATPDSTVLPRDGERWQMNLFRINYDALATASQPARRELSAWSPTGQMKFHIPSAFGDLIFREKPTQAGK
jgi:hypothetical protein